MKKRSISLWDYGSWILFVLFLLLMEVSCAVNPVTGKKELSLISENQEISLGEQTDKEIKLQYGIYEDKALENYVSQVGMSLVPHTHRPHLPYHFAILDTPVINAFAVPGGYIYVTRGILALITSEAELATVLGHELGHVNARHSVRRLSKMLIVQLGLALGSALSETFAKISGVASVGIQLLFLKFSRDDEREADRLGVEYARSARYNPSEMIGFFFSLQKLGDLSGGHSLPGFLSTHPLTKERIQNTKAIITEEDARLEVRKNPYLTRIDNLIFGNDPRQGYVEGNAFYHPLLRFKFSFPQEWKLQNTPSQVALSPEDGNAALILQAEKSSEPLPDYAEKKIASLEGKQPVSEKTLTINGMEAYEKVFEIIQEQREDLRTRMSFIRKGENIFTFTALSTSQKFANYDPEFRTIVGSFRELKEKKYLEKKPQRIRLIRASGNESLRSIFKREGMEEEAWSKMAIMNRLELDQIPEQNQIIKVVK